MFLKRIELTGFKSFADRTIVTFDQDVTGIVGPNGCGKSNITDAIRWVLGEQSAKSLRSGSSMTDIIFSGSQSRRPVNLARVSLVFDNSQKVFDSPFEEIEITREVSRATGESSCFINKTPCRLKDIADLVMDTGLGRDSLSIITQGNISSFADARPEERRMLFEEAAGVAKYKKRKKLSLSRLETMNANLERVDDLIGDLQSQMESLEQQAAKAKEYIQYREELASKEISVLAIQIETLQSQLEGLSQSLKESRDQQTEKQVRLQNEETSLESRRKEIRELDRQIQTLQSRYSALLERSYELERRKVELDEKRKYALEQKDISLKVESLKALCADAKYEYEDRKNRLDQGLEEMKKQTSKTLQLQDQLEEADRDLRARQSLQQSLSSQKMVLENKMASPYAHQQGVQAVLKARSSLSGIEGTVGQLLDTSAQYAQAIGQALAGAADQIVTRDEACARQAIGFLKKARAGRATFLPLSVCKAKSLYPDQMLIASSSPGILGRASEFVSNESRYDRVRERLLGNILIADSLENANEAAKRLKYAVKIVTLDGDVVHAGGAMSGGSSKSASGSLITVRRDLEQVTARFAKVCQECQELQSQAGKLRLLLQQEKDRQIQMRIDMEKLDNIVKVKQDKYESLKAQLSQLDSTAQPDTQLASDGLVQELSALHAQKDELISQLQLARTRQSELQEQSDQSESQIRQLRKEIASLSSQIHNGELEQARSETKIEQALMRLNTEYSLTYEAALSQKQDVDIQASLDRVKTLRVLIARLGDVNLQAPVQYDQACEKFDYLTSQKEELQAAAGQLLEAIDEMDQTMIRQFQEMFDKINNELDGIFKAMFGGGKASLSMENPQDVLNTGIDIDVQPPGKMVKNIQTFSGGEKALIAISVLFAILKARTVPLCIFDEVEAALDQANVERFARYITHFKDQSQFIVVTHRPGTMEQCDALYGITMQKDGVSRVLKVLLKDAVEIVEKAG